MSDDVVTIARIRDVVGIESGVTVGQLLSEQRTHRVVRARQIVCYLASRLTAHSLASIGRNFGGKDHTTVLNAVRRIKQLLPLDAELAAHVARFENLILADASPIALAQARIATLEAALSRAGLDPSQSLETQETR